MKGKNIINRKSAVYRTNLPADLLGKLLYVLQGVEKDGMLDDFLKWSGEHNIKAAYASTPENVLMAWKAILIMIVIFTAVSVITLKYIDKDKR